MLDSPHVRFIISLLVAFPLSAIISPPDIFGQLFVFALLVAVSYYLSYKGGYDALLSN